VTAIHVSSGINSPEVLLELKNKIWMTGSLEWFAYIGEDEVFLGRREVPYPLEEGDTWTNELGDVFRVEQGEIKLVERITPPKKYW
jgi:hypothetical protein